MLDKLNYKTKNLLLVILSLLVGYFAYSRAITATLNLKNECYVLEQQSLQAESASEKIKIVQLEISNINHMLGSGKKGVGDVNRELVEFVTDEASKRNLTLRDFPEVHFFKGPQMNLYTQPCLIQGNFKDIVKLLYDLENHFRGVNVTSVKFHTKQDMKTKKNYLYAECFIQSVHRN
jgi:hypothetical protein